MRGLESLAAARRHVTRGFVKGAAGVGGGVCPAGLRLEGGSAKERVIEVLLSHLIAAICHSQRGTREGKRKSGRVTNLRAVATKRREAEDGGDRRGGEGREERGAGAGTGAPEGTNSQQRGPRSGSLSLRTPVRTTTKKTFDNCEQQNRRGAAKAQEGKDHLRLTSGYRSLHFIRPPSHPSASYPPLAQHAYPKE